MNEKVDEAHKKALLEIIEDEKLKYSERWDKVVAYKKEHMGLKGFHFTVWPKEKFDPITNSIVYEDPTIEEVAHDLCMMEKSSLNGQLKEVTGKELDYL